MPMVDIQRRHAEVFRLRFGDKGPNGAPRKLTEAIRVTAPTEEIVAAFVDRYGGEVKPFAEKASRDKFQAYLPTTVITIMVLPGQSISQWWEHYRGSVCDRRCDGETETKSGKACVCPADIDERMADAKACSPTTRVSVLCPDVAVVGSGSFVTHGLIAAETLPQSIAVAEAALSRGLMVPATLTISEVRGRNHFIFPQIVITGMSLGELVTGSVNAVAELGVVEGEQRAIEAGFRPVPASLPSAPAPSIADQVAAANDPQPKSRRSNAAEPIPSTGVKPRTAAEAEQGTAPPPSTVTNGGRMCARCRQPLVGDVEKVDNGYVHKNGCPSPPDETDETSSTESPAGVDIPDYETQPEPQPELAGIGATSKADPEVYRDVDIHKLIATVFEPVKDAAPRGQKTKVIDRIRHTLIWGVTAGAKSSLSELTAGEKHRLWTEVSHLERGFNSYEVTDTALVLRPVGRPGDPISIPWVDESEAA